MHVRSFFMLHSIIPSPSHLLSQSTSILSTNMKKSSNDEDNFSSEINDSSSPYQSSMNPSMASRAHSEGIGSLNHAIRQEELRRIAEMNAFGGHLNPHPSSSNNQQQLLNLIQRQVLLNQLSQQQALMNLPGVAGSGTSGAQMPTSAAMLPSYNNQALINSLQPTKTCIRVPCSARAMPSDHNMKTAYFEISSDTEHGCELICSHEQCRNSGIKFRYCMFCKAPVAKRNFDKLHYHALHRTSQDSASSMVQNGSSVTTKNRPSPLINANQVDQAMAMTFQGHSLMDRPPISNDSNIFNPNSIRIDNLVATPSQAKRQKIVQNDMSVNLTDGSDRCSSKDNIKTTWMRLLFERPTTESQSELEEWLRRVLDVSSKWSSM